MHGKGCIPLESTLESVGAVPREVHCPSVLSALEMHRRSFQFVFVSLQNARSCSLRCKPPTLLYGRHSKKQLRVVGLGRFQMCCSGG